MYVKHAKNNNYSSREEIFKFDLHDLDESFFTSKNFVVDIAIDDSTHYLEDQLLFVKIMYPIISKGGLLIVEDILCPQEKKIEFEKLDIPFELIDMSHLMNSSDNALIIYKK